jgi:hypothetical protein
MRGHQRMWFIKNILTEVKQQWQNIEHQRKDTIQWNTKDVEKAD